jgi:hypothetical protein
MGLNGVLACPADLEVAAPAVPVEVEVALWDAEGELAKSWRGDITYQVQSVKKYDNIKISIRRMTTNPIKYMYNTIISTATLLI